MSRLQTPVRPVEIQYSDKQSGCGAGDTLKADSTPEIWKGVHMVSEKSPDSDDSQLRQASKRQSLDPDVVAFKRGQSELFAEIDKLRREPPNSFRALVKSVATFIVPPRGR